MTSNYHTQIPAGQASRTPVNAAFSDLDTAITALNAASNVTTTDVADAAITAAKLAASVAGDGLTGGAGSPLAVNPDGSTLEISSDALRIKALGVAASHIAANTITNTKMATDVSPGSLATLAGDVAAGTTPASFSVAMLELLRRRQNIVPDPLFLRRGPSRRVKGLQRFYNPQNISAWTVPQSSHPRGYGGSITGTSSFGKVIYAGGHGFKAGQTINFIAELTSATGTIRLSFRETDSDGVTFLGTTQKNGTAVAQDGSTKTISVLTTLEVDCPALTVFVNNTVGTDPKTIYSLWGSVGYAPLTPDVGDDADWLEEEALFPSAAEVYGRAFLRDWRGALAKSQQGTAAAVVAVIGDSWVQNDLITGPLRSMLTTAYGNAGTGWVSAVAYSGGAGASPPSGFTLTKAGTWTESDAAAGSRGVDIQHANSVDDSAPVGSMQLIGTMTDVYIHYLKQANGGSFRWRVDGGSWTTVTTANATNLHATEAVTGLSNASHTLDVEVVTASVAGVTLMGFDTRIGTDGVRLHKLGNGGATAGDYAAVDATIWQAGLTALAPNLCIIVLGTNDDSGNVVPNTFNTNISTIISRIRTAMPLCDILLLTPGPNGLASGTYSTDYYVNVLRSRAVADSLACYDLYLALGNYTDGNSRGLWANTSHLDADGGQQAADGLYETLLRVR